ncbi:hypothetical protein EPA93_07505 [Ktedonosporobacter rubrisoli]|uniref:Aminoglycoside phosphotransferase domain-containing protein n=1 Tax=Ktedonosporobacter rubrisoli TaxID=2509675 RepID=A0A4V0YYD7_KTERU|nr:phosphotransferase [Ktedonosporobacter rubrisoli]QBD75861.1 hypothetical protein EPA93_07505 [Ktedonosporobacter rubrisoli]
MTYDASALEQIRSELQFILPQLEISGQLYLLGSGFSSLVLETSQGVVLRLARNQDAAEGQAKEAKLLPFLQGKLPVAVPFPQWYVAPGQHFPFGVIGYPKLKGAVLQPQLLSEKTQSSLATSCAKFLCSLHAISPAEIQIPELPGPRAFWQRQERLCAAVLPELHAMLPGTEYSQVERWWDKFLNDSALRQSPSCLCHGDLWYENILVDKDYSAIAGILDFEDAIIADPALDFAALLHLGKPFTLAVIEAYQAQSHRPSPNLLYRIERYWEAREFGGLHFAIKHADQEEFVEALYKIRQGPILNPAQRFY